MSRSSTITATTTCANNWPLSQASPSRLRTEENTGRSWFKLHARGLTPADIVNAVNTQNLTLPSGLAKIGDTQYTVGTNAMPLSITDLNNIPIKYTNGPTVFLKDVGQVHDGWAVQQNIVQTLKAQDAAVSVAQSNVAAQENLLRVLRQNRDYASVVAPFDGIITQRNVDLGSLVQGNINSGTFMFEIVQKDVIRIFIYVSQDAALGVAPGINAIVRVPELPDREFPGEVTRIADALQSGTRTLLTEIDIPNPDGALPPGVYCTIGLSSIRR
jgi:hypothetical protein